MQCVHLHVLTGCNSVAGGWSSVALSEWSPYPSCFACECVRDKEKWSPWSPYPSGRHYRFSCIALYCTVCVWVCVFFEGDGCTFCSSDLSEFFSVVLLTSLRPRGGSGFTRVAPGVFLNFLGRGFRGAVARAVSFLSQSLSSSSLHSRWCS